MTSLTQTLEKLVDRSFVTDYLQKNGYPDSRSQLPRRVLLNDSQLAAVKPQLKLLPDHANVGLIGSFKQRLLVCNDTHPPDAHDDEGLMKLDGVSFTFAKTPSPKHEWEWEALGKRHWLDRRNEDKTKKEPAYAAITAYENIGKRGAVSADDLQAIVECAQTPYSVSWNIGTSLLCRLARDHKAARDRILEFTEANKAPIRWRAIDVVSSVLPKSFNIQILRLGLQDRSKKNRAYAVYRSRVLNLLELTDDLIELRRTEKNTDVLLELDWSINLLQKGYYFSSKNGSLWVRCKGGIRATGRNYTPDHFESNDIEAEVEKIRREWPDE